MEGPDSDKGVALAEGAPPKALPRARPAAPFEQVRSALGPSLPAPAVAALPTSWEKLGNVLVLPLPHSLEPWASPIAEAYAKVLGCGAVLRDAGPIQGAQREPVREVLWGKGTETVHVEGGVRFMMDAARIMWSSGNVTERQRIPRLVREGEVVVDLFAGIGYFSVPVAARAKPAVVHACELNPLAFQYLQRNVALNRVGHLVVPHLGDCRETAPRGVADRVLMGYTVDTERYLPTALAALKAEGGVVHYHEACPAHLWRERPARRVREAACDAGRRAEVLGQRVVKNYAPGMVHAVVDAEVR